MLCRKEVVSMETIYCVYDQKAEMFLRPVFVRSSGQAIRNFMDAVNEPEHEFCRHKEDYVLYAVGTWDDEKGSIVGFDVPKVVASAISLFREGGE